MELYYDIFSFNKGKKMLIRVGF